LFSEKCVFIKDEEGGKKEIPTENGEELSLVNNVIEIYSLELVKDLPMGSCI